jgi:hypothetical protein
VVGESGGDTARGVFQGLLVLEGFCETLNLTIYVVEIRVI